MQVSLKEIAELVKGHEPCDPQTVTDSRPQIVALHRGFVVVGTVSQRGSEVTISKGAFVRRWGTSHGLGELADNGPRSETTLDKFTELRVHEMGILFRLPCEEKKWNGKL